MDEIADQCFGFIAFVWLKHKACTWVDLKKNCGLSSFYAFVVQTEPYNASGDSTHWGAVGVIH